MLDIIKKPYIKTTYLILICLFSWAGYSQNNVLLKGKIIADSLDGSSINIVNLSQETGTTNNRDGAFELKARLYDTIVFSSVQYVIETVIVDPEIFDNRYIAVELHKKITDLDEVHISNISLTGNLEKDLAQIEIFDPSVTGVPVRTRRPPTSIERKLMAANAEPRAEGLINVNLDRIIYQVNGSMAELEKARKNEILENLVEKGIHMLPPDFFISDLKIPEKEIKNFVYYCAAKPAFLELVNEENHLKIIEMYRNKAPQFLQNYVSGINKDNKILQEEK